MSQQNHYQHIAVSTPLTVFAWVLFSLCCIAYQPLAHAQQRTIEFWHWWNSISELENAHTLNHYLQQYDLVWDNKNSLEGSSSIYLELLSKKLQHRYPDAAMLVSDMVKSYNQTYPLLHLDDVATEQGWDEVIPLAIQNNAKYQGHWVSLPLNNHSSNWLWINKELYARLQIPEPQTWDDLIAALDRAKALGIPALVTPRDDWEKGLMLESVIMSTGGLEFYRRVFVEQEVVRQDLHVLSTAFANLKQLSQYFSANTHNLTWDQGTQKMLQGEVLMQIHGSWVNSELGALAAQANQDFLCLRFPGTQGAYIFNSDHVVFFNAENNDVDTQKQLARILLEQDFQRSLSLVSGAAPARVDIATAGFDYCSKKNMHELRMANTRHAVVPSINRQEIEPVVSDFLENNNSAEKAAHRLLDILIRPSAASTLSAQ